MVTDQITPRKFERQKTNIASGFSKNPPGKAGRPSQLPDAVAEQHLPLYQMLMCLRKAH